MELDKFSEAKVYYLFSSNSMRQSNCNRKVCRQLEQMRTGICIRNNVCNRKVT